MVPKALLDAVLSLDEDGKLYLLKTLLRDPALEKHAYDPLGLRSNYEAARILREMIEQRKTSNEPSLE